MPNKLSYIFIALAILINTLSASTLELTKQEKAFIKAHPTIILGTDKSWIPYVVINKDGSITGYDQEVLNRINQLTGSNFKLKASKWSEVVIEAKNKVIDGLSTGSIQEERSKYLNFSAPYVKIKYIFLTSRSEKKTSLKNIDDIDGHTIGIQKGNLVTKQIIKKFKNLKVIEYDNYSEIIKTVITDEVDLVLIADHLSIFYRVSEFKIPFLRPIALLDKETNLVFSVRKDYPEAISIINKALDYMGEKELKKIKNKYFRGSLYESTKTSVFKQEELSYLSNKKEIKMCIDPNWMPLEKIAQGKAIGYTSDFMQLVGDKINIPINLVATKTWSESLKNMENRLCDIIPIVAHTPKFEKHMDFTSPYLSIQVVLATKASVIYINDLENQLDKTFAVVKNYALNTYLKSKYPTLKIVNVDSIHDGLVKVVNEEVFGYIDNSAVIRHAIQRDFFSTLAITGKIDLEMHYSVGTRNDEKILNSIFEKATSSINNSDKQDIKNRWFSFKQSPKIDYDLLRKIISIFVIIFIIITTFLFISRKKNQKLKIAQEKIEEFNLTLQEQVETEVERNKQQELLMFQQSRLAQMGEMINMIAHQWRQPLSTINGLVMVMDMKRSKQNLENRLFLEEEFNEIESLTAHMSDTIDDFRNFFKPEKQKIKFQLKDNIEHAIGLVRPVLSHKNILISTRYQKNVELLGYPNEFGQVIVNIINNAKDALLMDTENKIKEIYIQLSTKNQSVILSIEDNAKGISEELLPHIFDPYFSTKSEKNGTGLGLYISKMIIEEHMGGELYVENTSLGAKFTIKFNLSNANNK